MTDKEKELKDKDSQLNNWYKEWQKQNERIAELEQKLEQTEKDLADYQFNYPTIKELQKENAELRAIAENQQSSNMERYFKNKELEKENARLKEINAHTLSQLNLDNGELIIENEKLKKENAELKEKLLNESYEKAKLVEKWKRNGENIIQECKDIEGANAHYEHQLANAKELLKRCYENYIYLEPLRSEIEQFLSEIEK